MQMRLPKLQTGPRPSDRANQVKCKGCGTTEMVSTGGGGAHLSYRREIKGQKLCHPRSQFSLL